jgi:hypothetical protein
MIFLIDILFINRLTGLLSFMVSEEVATGAMTATSSERMGYASRSHSYNMSVSFGFWGVFMFFLTARLNWKLFFPSLTTQCWPEIQGDLPWPLQPQDDWFTQHGLSEEPLAHCVGSQVASNWFRYHQLYPLQFVVAVYVPRLEISYRAWTTVFFFLSFSSSSQAPSDLKKKDQRSPGHDTICATPPC